jgi:hypothetical protein
MIFKSNEMKSKIVLVILFLILMTGLKAQKPIETLEDSIRIANSVLPAISVTIPEADYDRTLKLWIKELQSGTKSKVVTENGEMSIFGAKIKDISPNPVNVYSKLVKLDSMVQLVASFELKKDVYVERGAGEADFVKASEYLKDFSKSQYIDIAKGQAEAEEKKLRSLEKELSSLENEKSRLQRSIQSDKSTILSEKENITVQNNELSTVSAALIDANAQLSTMEPGPAQKEKSETIKDLEKRKKKALNSIESSENKINRSNSDIDKAEAEIPRNEKMQERVREQIDQQRAVYNKYADKLKKIKSY